MEQHSVHQARSVNIITGDLETFTEKILQSIKCYLYLQHLVLTITIVLECFYFTFLISHTFHHTRGDTLETKHLLAAEPLGVSNRFMVCDGNSWRKLLSQHPALSSALLSLCRHKNSHMKAVCKIYRFFLQEKQT